MGVKAEGPLRDLLGLADLPAVQILRILDLAAEWKAAGSAPRLLEGRRVCLLFFEASTRTRASFEVAARNLGAEVLALPVESSSVAKGESLEDTLANLERLGAGCFVLRHPESGSAERAARAARVPVVNAGDGRHEHPTQGLLDLFTLREKKGRLKGLKVVVLGDILHSRVARSNLWGLRKLGAKVVLCGPPTLLPRGLERWAELAERPEAALKGADAVIVLRLQSERQQEGLLPSLDEYRRLYGLSEARLALAKPDCLVLHPGPMNRGVEIESAVADGPRSVILDQVANGVFVRMAVFAELAQSFKEAF